MRTGLEPAAAYVELTEGLRRDIRVDDLVLEAAQRFPELGLPTRPQMAEEDSRKQADKLGLEVPQGAFLSRILADPEAGLHLVYSMLRPTMAATARLPAFQRSGHADLGPATVERIGNVGHVNLRNLRYLNAEDGAATAALEVGVDLVLLDPGCEIGVLRGAVVRQAKYAGRRVFNAGLNLTHLYHGRISFAGFMMARELGLVSKIYRGLWLGDDWRTAVEETQEKPWIAAVEGFAIGGGCQLLLVHDRVIAERGAFFTLPARKEGIIPGAANLRLWRFLGDRTARQSIMFERGFTTDDDAATSLCDRVVEPAEMDAAIAEDAAQLISSGTTAAAANRRAIRIGQEPVDAFRTYMAVYAREQALCMHSPALIRNLEQDWRAHERAL
jgi:thioesterase DpgC